MTTYEFVERLVEENGLQPILDAKYNGSIVDFIRVNELDDPFMELPISSYGVENLEDYVLSIFAEDQYELEQAEREAAKERRLDKEASIWYESYHGQVEPLMERAVAYAMQFPELYSVYESGSSTYIHGPSGTIRFSDHGLPIDYYDSEGRPVYRGGWRKRGPMADISYGSAPDMSVDPTTVSDIDWPTVKSMLKQISEEEEK